MTEDPIVIAMNDEQRRYAQKERRKMKDSFFRLTEAIDELHLVIAKLEDEPEADLLRGALTVLESNASELGRQIGTDIEEID